jgi:uncharacterized membrane protein YphA (DoxX/SURF4 family)
MVIRVTALLSRQLFRLLLLCCRTTALGLGARLAGLALFGDMVMAMITVRWVTGINNSTTPPGYQLNLTLGVLALVMVVFGAGRFSIDALAERHLVPLEPSRAR